MPKRPRSSKKFVARKKARVSTRISRALTPARQVHRFTRMYGQVNIAGNAAYFPYLNSSTFQLSDLPNATEFTSLFDQFKLTHVKMYVHLRKDPGAQSAANAIYPRMYVVRDFTDATTPATIDELRQYSTCQCKVLEPNKRVSFNIKPALLQAAYRSAVSTAYSPVWNRWVDVAYADAPHYGIKYAIDDLTNTNYSVWIEYKYWFSCRNTK